MKKFFIAAVMMVAAMSVNAKSNAYFFTHSSEEVVEAYGEDGAMELVNNYISVVRNSNMKNALSKTLNGFISLYNIDHDAELLIDLLQEFNEKFPDLFND